LIEAVTCTLRSIAQISAQTSAQKHLKHQMY
jgi:hypothetical protein